MNKENQICENCSYPESLHKESRFMMKNPAGCKKFKPKSNSQVKLDSNKDSSHYQLATKPEEEMSANSEGGTLTQEIPRTSGSDNKIEELNIWVRKRLGDWLDNPDERDMIQVIIDLTQEHFLKKIDEFFIEEDKILKKAMDKLSFLMVSRNISQEKERKELVKLREELKKDLGGKGE